MARVLYITNAPTPYRLPLYRALAGSLGSRGDAFSVFFLGYAKSRRAWRITPDDLHGFEYRSAGRTGSRAAFDAIGEIARLRPDRVVIAWAMDHVALGVLAYARLRRLPVLVVSGETAHTAAHNPHPRLRRMFRALFFRLATRFITYGERSTAYLRSCGVDAARITTGINTVDVAFFAERTDALRTDGSADRTRGRFTDAEGGAFRMHVLFVGYLHGEKGVAEAIDALARLGRTDIALHIVGTGPDEGVLRAMTEARGLGDRIFFHGYRQLDELPAWYAMADVAIVPSTVEVFGLVLVEAAASGLAVIAGERAGGTTEVVEDGIGGLIVEPTAPALADAIARLADDPALRASMGAAVRERVLERMTIAASAGRYIKAFDAMVPHAAREAQTARHDESR